MNKDKCILDADVIVYMACAGSEETPNPWEEGVISVVDNAKIRAERMVEDWVAEAGCGEVKLAFSCPKAQNFRLKVYPQYKSNRVSEKPEGYSEVAQYLKDTYTCITGDVIEGDDILGMHMGNGWTAVSTDKDMRTVPGKFVHIRVNGTVDKYDSSEYEANRFWMWQTLVGDTSDGYKGCPGCGRKGADALLNSIVSQDLHTMWDNVVRRYEEAWNKPKMRAKFFTGHPYDEALMNARVARILRDGDYPITGVELWTP